MKILFIGSEFVGRNVQTLLLRDNKDHAFALVRDFVNACTVLNKWEPELVIHEWDEDDCSLTMQELAVSRGIPVLALTPELSPDVRRILNRIDRAETLDKPDNHYIMTSGFHHRLVAAVRRLETLVKPKRHAA
ncbi:MAG: hypothetical protein HPY53_14820 [Brevinematales bacterium]|nr:hypothetical protein [Brevinematales bacterium]